MTPEEIIKLVKRYNIYDAQGANDRAIEAIKAYAREMCETALAERDAEISQLKARVAELEQGWISVDSGDYPNDLQKIRVYHNDGHELSGAYYEGSNNFCWSLLGNTQYCKLDNFTYWKPQQ